MTEEVLKEALDDFASASRQGEWDIARNRILAAFAELRTLNAEMLEALKDAQLWIVEAILGMGGIPDADVTILPAIRAAIAKAEKQT